MRRELRNQPMKEVGEYTAGVKDGTWRYFDEKGMFSAPNAGTSDASNPRKNERP